MKSLVSIVTLFLFFGLFAKGAVAPDTLAKEKHFSKAQLTADVEYLTSTIADVHPDMYHAIGKTKYNQLKKQVLALLRDSMAERQAWPIIAPLIGALNEGHSSLNFPDDITTYLKSGPKVLFPVNIREFDGESFVVRADGSDEDALLPGDKIISINGISAGKLVDSLSLQMGGLKLWRANDVCRNLIAYLDIYNIHGPYHIKYTRDAKTDSAVISPASFTGYVNRLKAKLAKLPKTLAPSNYSFDYPAGGNAILTINSLSEKPEKFKQFLDSVFTVLKQKPAKGLIIDLRRNGGGNSALGEMLLGYITDRPFRMTGGVKWKVSQEYKDQLSKNLKGDDLKNMDYYLKAKNGSVFKSEVDKPAAPAHNDLLFTGKVLVLIGPKTFSSANMLANTMEDYKLATLIGEPSGEPANDYGELIFVTLPNTGFTFSTSVKQFVRANGDAKNQRPVMPNYPIKDDPATAVDEVMEFAKGLVAPPSK